MISTLTLTGWPLVAALLFALCSAGGIVWLIMRNKLELAQQRFQLYQESDQQLQERLAHLSQQALQQNNDQFLTLAEQRFTRLQEQSTGELGKKQQAIDALVKPLQESLKQVTTQVQAMEKTRAQAYGDLSRLVTTMNSEQEKLRHETTQLSRALRKPEVRGQWGEMQLLRTLELAGMQQGIHFDLQTQQEGERGDGMKVLRPDVIVHLPSGRDIIIDAKVPLSAYLEAARDDLDEEQRNHHLKRHAAQLYKHMQQLSKKSYWRDHDTVELVVMFLPDEGFLRSAVESDPDLLDRALHSKVVPASPITLFALLKAVMYGWQQQQVTEKARDIATLGKELYGRIGSFTEHMRKVGNGLNSALTNYNNAVGSLESRVMPSLRKFEEFETTDLTNKAVTPQQLSQAVREIAVEVEENKVA